MSKPNPETTPEHEQVTPRTPVIDPALTDLFTILNLRRACNSQGERELINRFLVPLDTTRDGFGNFYIRIGTAPIMWSAHTDTVHDWKGGVKQKLLIDEEGFVSTDGGDCLGADNGAGVWLLLRMIAAGKEGLYIFHRQEETGGKGSAYITGMHPDLVKDIKFAVAFDRRGTQSVITHQGSRTCSDAFADSLIEQLGMNHVKDDSGTFTDTANYKKLIPECTNISVGFYKEHSYQEHLDTVYLKKLLAAVLAMDINKLVAERDPAGQDEWPESWWSGYDSWGQFKNDAYKKVIIENPYLVFSVLQSWGMVDEMVKDMDALTELYEHGG